MCPSAPGPRRRLRLLLEPNGFGKWLTGTPCIRVVSLFPVFVRGLYIVPYLPMDWFHQLTYALGSYCAHVWASNRLSPESVAPETLSEAVLITACDTFLLRYVHTCAERTRAEVSGKLASTQIITCVHQFTHVRGRGAEAGREQNLLRSKLVQHPIFRVRFETARFKPSVRSRNGRSARARTAYVWTYPEPKPHKNT